MLKKMIFALVSFSLVIPSVTGTLYAEELPEVFEEETFNKNLVKNGDFEITDTAPLSNDGGAWLDVDLWKDDIKAKDWELQMWRPTRDPKQFNGEIVEEASGNKYVNMRVEDKSGDSQMFFKQMGIPVSAGTVYKASLKYRVNSLNGSNISFRVEEVNGSNQVTKTNNFTLTNSSDWTTFEQELLAPEGVVKYNIIIVSPTNTLSDFDIDDVQISFNDKEVNSISMDKTPLRIRETEISYVNAIALPETAVNKVLHYNSSDESVATIESNGKITALAKGTTTITVTSDSNPNVFETKTVTVIGADESKNPNLMPNGDFELTEAAPTGSASGGSWMDNDMWINDIKPESWNFQKYPVTADTTKFQGEVIDEAGNKHIKLSVTDALSNTQAFFKTKVEELPDYGMYNMSFDIKMTSFTGTKPFIRVEDAWRSGTVIMTTEYPLDVELGEWETVKHQHTLQKNSVANVVLVIPLGSTVEMELDNATWTEVEKDVTSIELNKEPTHIKLGEGYKVEATVLPDYASDKSIFFESSDESIATVDAEGNVKGISEGKVDITVTSFQKPSITNTKEVYVHDGDILAESLIIRDIEDEVGAGNKRFLKYTPYPASSENVDDLEVEWSTSDESVATINDDVITFLKPGEFRLKVENKDLNLVGEKTITVLDSTYSEDFQLIKDRLIAKIVGTETLNNSNDKYVDDYIAKAEKSTEDLLASLDTSENRDKLWNKSSNSNNITAEFQRIRSLAVSFAMPNNKYYEDPELHKTIVDAIDFMLTTTQFGTGWSGNWWDWQVGGSQAFADTMILLDSYNYSGLTEEYAKAISLYNYDVKKQLNGAVNTGANLSDSALVVLAVAVVRNDENRMEHIKKEVPTIFTKGTSGDGMYDDGSLIQHTNHGYNGSYGAELIKGAGIIISMIRDTEWEINKDNTDNLGYFFETLEKGFIPMVQNGHVLDFVSGRDVSRPPQRTVSSPTQKNGSNYMASLLTIAEFAPADLQLKIKQHVKYWYNNSKDYFDYLADPRDFQHLSNLEALIADDTITPKVDEGFYSYNMMTRALYRTDTFTASVTMTNKRIANYESINREHLKGWNTGDGAMYVYNKELDNFNESYRPTVDYNRIPGTTTDTKDLAIPNANSGKTSPGIDWGSGTTNGKNGTAATMIDKSLQNQKDKSGVPVNLKATKSYYFIDGKVIALGSNINGTTNDSLETIIENRIITKSGKGSMSVNGTSINELSNFTVQDNDWAYLGGKDTETSFGYIFLEGGNIDAGKVNRTGIFKDINEEFNIPDVFNEDYFQIRYNHGQVAVDDTYAYVMLPGYSKDETKAFAEDSGIVIIKQDSEAHIVYDKHSNILMANVFVPGVEVDLTATNLSLTSTSFNSVGSYIIEKEGTTLTSTMSDGTLHNNGVELVLEGDIEEVLSNDSKVTVTEDNGKQKVVYDTNGSQGVQQQASFKVSRNKSDLASLVDEAKTYDEMKYTKVSFDAFKIVLDKAIGILATRTVHDDMYIELEAAIDALVLAGDYIGFDTYRNQLSASLESDNYTNYSQEKIKEKLKTYDNLVEERVVETELQLAKDEITAFVSTQNKRLDVAKIIKVINEFKEVDSKNYTKESYASYKEAMEALKDLYNKYDENAPLVVTQAELDEVYDIVVEKYDGLVLNNDIDEKEKEQDKDKEKVKEKEDSKKPSTGIKDNSIILISIISLAAVAVFLLLKKKKTE